ncbi:transcobalamin-2 [Alligator mississippiensis]|nr:transcobalamin-2 [Alligator mississippiensis]XP_019349305.1 transcobalamin-2 [Alligator mississippiensis]
MNMEPRRLRIFFLFCALVLPVQLCEIPRMNSDLIGCLNRRLMSVTEDLSKELNPSVYMALRLSSDHNLKKEAQYFHRLKNAFQAKEKSFLPAGQQVQPKTGHLALYLLALRAACQDMKTREMKRLVTRLKHDLHKEKEQIGPEEKGHPITNYYQYSLGVLALCVHGKKIDTHVIQKLINAEMHNKFTHGTKLSVDTEAMAGLAFHCLKQSRLYTRSIVSALLQAVQSVKKKILQAQTPEGTFGNIFSSPLAMQVLVATGMSNKKSECSRGMNALLGTLEHNHDNLMMMSQLLPVLHGKSYLDIATMGCQAERDTLQQHVKCPESSVTALEHSIFTIQLSVQHPSSHEELYNHSIQVPSGSSLLDVLGKAQNQGSKLFTFETRSTLQGPMLTTVMGIEAKDAERSYWQLLKAPDTSLEKGVSDYRPQDGESIILKLSHQ